MSTKSSIPIPLIYRLFFLYVEPLSALAGAYYAALQPSSYLHDLLPFVPTYAFPPTPPSTSTLMTLYQLANLYLLFALNEHFVLSSTNSIRTWKALLAGLLVADVGHLMSMVPAGRRAFEVWEWREWNAMVWGSVGFVYFGAGIRVCFLAGVGLGKSGKAREKHE